MIDYRQEHQQLATPGVGLPQGRLNSLVGSFLGVRQENKVNMAGSS